MFKGHDYNIGAPQLERILALLKAGKIEEAIRQLEEEIRLVKS